MEVRPDFDIREFVPPLIWRKYGKSSVWFLDQRMLDLAQFYRDFFEAPVRVNDWHYGGTLTLRGYRPPSTEIGARFSQHKFGRAFDCNIEGFSPEEVRQIIYHNEDQFMDAGLTTLEDGSLTPTWTHSDIRHTGAAKIKTVGT